MRNDIIFLIQKLEEEQASLRLLIDTAVKCGEYLMAHHHSEAIGNVNRQLQTLRNLDDKKFDEKKSLERMIKGAEKQLHSSPPDKLKVYFENEILKNKQKLEALHNLEKVEVPESSIIVQHLDLLVKNKVKRIKIILSRSHDYFIEVKRHKAGIKVVIPNLKRLRKDYSIREANLSKFNGLGFKITNQENQLTLILNQTKSELVYKLMTLISVIVFEVHYFKEFKGESFLEID